MNKKKIIVTIPHAGIIIPEDIRQSIVHSDRVIRNESDLYTDQMYTIPGPSIVQSQYSRLIADPNRAPDELYTEGTLRSQGVVMLSLPEGHDMFDVDPDVQTMQKWVEQYHTPFHAELAQKTKDACFLIDAHSMWSAAAPGHYGADGDPRADIVLGNQYFCSCSAETTHFFKEFYEQRGYSVAINDPYPGRYILGTYCSRIDLPGIQIEINRKLYMNEDTLDPREKDIKKLNTEFAELIDQLSDWFSGCAPPNEKPMTDMSE